MKNIFRYCWIGLLLMLALLAFSSCAEMIPEHTIPDGTYKIVFHPGEDAVKVQFKNGNPADPEQKKLFWDFENGVVVSRLYENDRLSTSGFVASGFVVHDYKEKEVKWRCVQEYDANTIDPGEKLYADWQRFSVNVEQIHNDKPMGNRQNIEYGEKLSFSRPSMTDMYFIGWFNADRTVQYSVGTEPCYGMDVMGAGIPFNRETLSIAMYPVFEEKNVTLKLDLGNGAKESFSADRKKELTQEMLPKPEITNQVFKHWSVTQNGEPYQGIPQDGMTLYAVWDYFKPTVYHTGTSAGDFAVNVFKGTPYAPEVPVLPGYRFTGWYATADCSGAPIAVDTMHYDQLLSDYYAGWQKTSYTLKFAEGGFADISYDYGYGTDSLPVMSRAGYIFEGWCTDAACTTTPVKRLGADAYGDYTLYPKFTPRTYTVTLEADASGYPKSVQIAYGASYSLEVPPQSGKTFKGWYNSAGEQYTDANGHSLKPYENLENIRLHAVYEEDEA